MLRCVMRAQQKSQVAYQNRYVDIKIQPLKSCRCSLPAALFAWTITMKAITARVCYPAVILSVTTASTSSSETTL